MSKKRVALYHKVALSIGVSDSALGVLYALLEAETPCSQYDLCSEWFIPKQTINSSVAALQEKGLIFLSPVAGTKNKKSIALTDVGKEFAAKNIVKLRNAELHALLELTPEEREQYIRLNQKYNKSLTEKLECFFVDSCQDKADTYVSEENFLCCYLVESILANRFQEKRFLKTCLSMCTTRIKSDLSA